MIVQTIDESQFVDAFRDYNREENFSVQARRALFDFYDDLSDDIREPFELDVIAICCDWAQYTFAELLQNYSGHVIDWPRIARYVVDLDERGEYKATIYQVEPDESETVLASVDGSMFEENGELDGVPIDDIESIIDKITSNNCEYFDYYLSASDDLPDEIHENIIETLQDHTTVIELDDTYLLMAF